MPNQSRIRENRKKRNYYRQGQKTQQKQFTHQYNQKCRFYKRNNCHFGNKCRYSHSGMTEVYLIRHAESIYNKKCQQSYNSFDLSPKDTFQGNSELIDCGLSEIGFYQIENMPLPIDSYVMNKGKMYIDAVFVSPLCRALQTTQLILINNSIIVNHVIVLPQLTQVLSKVCDFSSDLANKKKTYKYYDFSLMKQAQKDKDGFNFWQDSLVDQEYRSMIDRRYQNGLRYMPILQSIFPSPLENRNRCIRRSKCALQFIRNTIKEHKWQKVLVISHNRILKNISSQTSSLKQRPYENCQIRKITIQ